LLSPGRFKLIEFNDSYNVFGINYLHPTRDDLYVEYTRVKQIENG